MDLEYILNKGKFQKIQDRIAEATGMALLTVDYRGIPVTKHSYCSELCASIRKHENYRKLCEKCDSRGGLEAARIQQPYIYICHIGLVDFAIPIIVDDQYLGAVMAGQILIKDDQEKQNLERIVNEKYCKINFEQEPHLKELYEKLPVMSWLQITAVANMVFEISNYIVGEAVVKASLYEANQPLSLLGESQTSQAVVHPHVLQTQHHKSQVEDIPTGIKDLSKTELLYKGSEILKPALVYMEKNYHEKLHLDDMAGICNVSSSYFSKLFNREMDENFSSYVNKLKVTKAIELLETTDMPIMNISLNLGFENCGYFIKVFKRITGRTPAAYRMDTQYVKHKNN